MKNPAPGHAAYHQGGEGAVAGKPASDAIMRTSAKTPAKVGPTAPSDAQMGGMTPVWQGPTAANAHGPKAGSSPSLTIRKGPPGPSRARGQGEV